MSAPEKFWRWCRRSPLVATLTVCLVLAFLGGLLATFWQWRRADQAWVRTSLANARLRETLAQMDAGELQRAEGLGRQERAAQALPYPALVLRNNPSNRIAANQLMSMLSSRTWARLACPPLEHSNRVNSAVFSADGSRILTTASDHTAWIWETDTGRCLLG